MTLVLRILLLIGALFAMGIVINSVRKSKIRISDSVYWVVSAGILVLFALIPQLAYFFAGLFGFMSPANFVLLLVIVLMLIRIFHQSCAISKLTYKVEQLSDSTPTHKQYLKKSAYAADFFFWSLNPKKQKIPNTRARIASEIS